MSYALEDLGKGKLYGREEIDETITEIPLTPGFNKVSNKGGFVILHVFSASMGPKLKKVQVLGHVHMFRIEVTSLGYRSGFCIN